MVTVTLEHEGTCRDTLTWWRGSKCGHLLTIHGRSQLDSGYIPGLSIDGHSYSGILGYSEIGGVDIPGLSMDGDGYSGIRR